VRSSRNGKIDVTDDQTLRIALLVIVLAVFPIGIYYRLRSQATREPLDRWQEGLFMPGRPSTSVRRDKA
jgi:hypothetical protein